jgi:hypothetical protein
MKRQAWGWLAAAVVAAGLNASYHDGGLQWVHEAVDQVKHNTNAVLALATGRGDQFMAEAELVAVRRDPTPCPFAAEVADARHISPREFRVERVEAFSARQQAELARLEVNRARIESKLAHLRIPAVALNQVVVQSNAPLCPRIHVSIPRIPAMKMPATPVVHVEKSGFGSV